MNRIELEEIIASVGEKVDVHGCDGTHRFTEQWALATGRDVNGVVDFVKRHGGLCCDCEVLLNVPFDLDSTVVYPGSPALR